jgi:hypothetical protein
MSRRKKEEHGRKLRNLGNQRQKDDPHKSGIIIRRRADHTKI